ncbi:hypothetical protein BDR07DRAFT_701540 [Suillus spraguei]|nr:hypothetical protein BDR07DRAFT_701540 [Suillus spraguei]
MCHLIPRGEYVIRLRVMMVLGRYCDENINDSRWWSRHCALWWTDARGVVVCSGQKLVDFVQDALWRLLVDVGHVTRECIVLELTTSVRRFHSDTVSSEHQDRFQRYVHRWRSDRCTELSKDQHRDWECRIGFLTGVRHGFVGLCSWECHLAARCLGK